MNQPKTVLVPEDTPFDLEMILSAAEQNSLDAELMKFIKSTFENQTISRLVSERSLPMPDAFYKTGLGASFEWHLDGIAYEITFENFFGTLRINPGLKEISSGAYTKPMMSLGEAGLIELIERIAAELKFFEEQE